MPLRRPAALAVRTVALALLSLPGCRREHTLFERLDPDDTGITFENRITTNDSINLQTEVYVYNGAGVAIGDVDNDGLPDVFLAGNQVSSRLYRNEGEMKFEDVTTRAGVGTTRWASGASMVDINADGWLDIYVSISGYRNSKAEDRANLLFVNDGDGTFTERAAEYGLADVGFTIHAAFLDYDGDGCLDVFLLNNSPHDFTRGADFELPGGRTGETPGSNNELYRNACQAGGTPHFTNVSEQAGILRAPGFGLGVAVSDLNRDGRPDIYVSNDASPNDVLYVNNGDGTFTDRAGRWLKRASVAGMGVDIADFNDDGWPDIVQADMMPRTLERRKRITGTTTYSAMLESLRRGFRQDYSMNSLQLSNGVTPSGDIVFSEISRLAGVEATDWSWSTLFVDFDSDGRKDILITSGYPRAVNDVDYRSAAPGLMRGAPAGRSTSSAVALLNSLPTYAEPKFAYRNEGGLTFSERGSAWGLADSSFSYGAAYADLDNDGRLDLVVNNIDAQAFVYHNVGPAGDAAPHRLQVRLRGDAPNTQGIGATLTLSAGGRTQHLYHNPYRGYMSSMDERAFFGLGDATRADSLVVEWPDGRRQVLRDVAADQVITVTQAQATERRPVAPPTTAPSFVAAADVLPYRHLAQPEVAFAVQPLLPYLISNQGPVLAVADVDGDGLDDVYVGGSPVAAARLYHQRGDGRFVASSQPQPWATDSTHEDWGALFFDANGDGREDLYVASGGYQLAPTSPRLQDRLYINQGGGRFARDTAALPPMLTSTAAVRAGDFDGDGDADLFVGGRLSPREWPKPARSYVLRNEGGRFTDVTETVAPELARPNGMVTDAVWIDYDGDRRLDLVTTGEWMPIEFYRNQGGRLVHATTTTKLPPTRGWWYSLAAGDFDGDGRPDLVAGNLGLNHTYKTSSASRFGVYAADLTRNGTLDIVLTQGVDGVEYPLGGFASLGRAVYTLGAKFPTAGAFAQAPLAKLLGPNDLKDAVHYEADTFASMVLRNAGDGTFRAESLPDLAQIAPIRGIVVDDVDGDGNLDAIVAGNVYDTDPYTPRADAGNGLWLRGDGKGRFVAVPPVQSGFLAPGNVAGLALVGSATGRTVLVANTADSLQAFRVARTQRVIAAANGGKR